MKGYNQVNYSELVKIETYMRCGFSQSDIGIEIERNKSTISRLIKTYTPPGGEFDAEVAWKEICRRKGNANSHPKILSDSMLEKYILEKIETFWTPQQIAGRWKADTGEIICHETIYQYIYKYHPKMVKLYFRRKGRRYRRDRDPEKYSIPDMRMIDERSEEVEFRKELGHWEGDTVIGKDSKLAILTNVERKSGYLLAEKLSSKRAEETADIYEELFSDLPDEMRLTLTVDQGREFAWHKIIEAETKMTVYFCHKASPWEKGSNENTNGLLRWFIPKGTDLNTVSEKDLAKYVDLLNNRPRKRLNYLTPKEVFFGISP